MAGSVPHGCGQCLPCRINRRRLWSWRMFYESQLHEANSFVTLTYSEEHVPTSGSLVPADLTNFFKRLRSSISPQRVRYFAVGEYGDNTQRPHYHCCLFGLGPDSAEVIDSSWGLGFSFTAEFNQLTAQYCAGYVVKKMTASHDARLDGRYPEFARMSRRPGIGAGAMALLAEQLSTDAGLNEILALGDVPSHLRMGNRSLPIGRYLRQKLREEMGMPEEFTRDAKQKYTTEKESEVQALFIRALKASPRSAVTSSSAYLESIQGQIWSIEGRDKIAASKKRKTL